MDFILWWQTLPSKMDPILLSIGSFSIYWYSTMYLVAFGVVYLLCRKEINNNKFTKLTLSEFEDLLSWCFIALILGARLGYVLFYNFEYYLANPLEILLPFSIQNGVWKFTGIAGMSYHGGLIGVLIAMWVYGRNSSMRLFISSLWILEQSSRLAINLQKSTTMLISHFLGRALWKI